MADRQAKLRLYPANGTQQRTYKDPEAGRSEEGRGPRKEMALQAHSLVELREAACVRQGLGARELAQQL